ncbi:MAG: type II secretion system protein [Victivallaceae bacterium]|nr:type II secretion system protein [Victivallaceae bacterium]
MKLFGKLCRQNQRHTNAFTLIEVVVAMAILSLGVVGTLQLLTSSQQKLADAREKWERTHLLMQAAEYLLLQAGDEAPSIPLDFFDSTQYRIECRYEDVTDLPEELSNQEGQLPLKTCKIELLNAKTGETVDQLAVDRFSYADTVAEE